MVHCSCWLLVMLLTVNFGIGQSGRVRVKIYDHRAQHDPREEYGKGPWHFLG